MIGTHEAAGAKASLRETGSLVRTSNIGGKDAAIGEAGNDQLDIEERISGERTGREIRRIGDRLPGATEDGKGSLLSEKIGMRLGGGHSETLNESGESVLVEGEI